VLLGLGHWAGAWLLAVPPARPGGVAGFAFAGSLLLALGFPVVLGSPLAALPLLALAAYGLTRLSGVWGSGGVRAIGYLWWLSLCAVLIALVGRPEGLALPWWGVVVAAVVAGLAFAQYVWCRRSAPPAESFVFGVLDPHDRSAVLLLLVSLISGFFMVRIVAYEALNRLLAEPGDAFICVQSVVINLSALGLMVVAFRRVDREVRNIGIMVTIIGALKVFVFDLLQTKGPFLVASLFTFGLAAAVGSSVLRRWHQREAERSGAAS